MKRRERVDHWIQFVRQRYPQLGSVFGSGRFAVLDGEFRAYLFTSSEKAVAYKRDNCPAAKLIQLAPPPVVSLRIAD